jgi:hypothetical protein
MNKKQVSKGLNVDKNKYLQLKILQIHKIVNLFLSYLFYF